MMVYADGSLGAGFRLSGVDISVAPTDLINEVATSIENLLNTAEEGLKLQFFYRLTPHVNSTISEHERITASVGDLYAPIAESRIKFLRENATLNRYFSPEIYFFIRSKPHSYRKQKLWESQKLFQELTKKEYAEHLDKFYRSIRQIESSLGHASLKPSRLSAQDWFGLLYEFLNLTRSEKHACPELPAATALDIFDEPLAARCCLTDLEVHSDHIRMGEHLFRVLTLKTLPEGASQAAMMNSFLGLPFYFWLSQTVSIQDQKKEIERLQLQRRLAHSMASGAGNVADLESESKLGHIEELIRDLLEGSEKIVSMDVTCIVWGKSIEELEEKSDEVLKAFKGVNQAEGVIETLPAFDAFIGALPGVCEGLRSKKVKSSNAAHFAPAFSSWRGNKRPVCLLPNRDGVLVSVDPFAPELPAWNGMVLGSTGSGKSFGLLQLILQFYGQNPRPKVVWIDNGASSQRAIEVLGGEFVDLNIHSGIRLNAFDLPPGETKPSPSKVKLLLAVLEMILKDEERAGLPKREKALLEEVIFDCYVKVKDRAPQLSDLRDLLKKHKDDELRSYAEILYSWTGDTAYGRMLDGPSNVHLTKNLTTIEIKGLDVYPDLQNVFLLLATDFVRTEASRDISQPFLFVIDEGWKIFQTPAALSFALEAYRTFRKFNAGIWCISQNYKDFLFSEAIASAILPNTTSIFILKQRGIDWEDFKTRLGLNDTELEAVKSLKSSKGEFTEVFFMQDEGRSVFRVMPDPLSYWICTSDPRDKAEIERVQNENPELSKLEVLEKICAARKKVA
ncbi:MAG: TraC family protein [Bdellovibrionales bacterium]|nr:TraC family protein [Bdellovibrionales bacterium]